MRSRGCGELSREHRSRGNVMRVRLLGAVCIFALVLVHSRAESGGPEYIVTLKDGQSIAALNKAHKSQTIGYIPNTSIYLIKTDNDADDGQVLKKLQKDKSVASVEKNTHIKLRSSQSAPLDPSVVEQGASLLDGQTLTTFFGTQVLKAYVNQQALTITHIDDVRGLSTGA